MSRQWHYHRCEVCRAIYRCEDVLIENFDGWPEVLCATYDERGWRRCEACATLDEATDAA